eukprot:11713386-Alexandrium_andersonii.AAC.1
MAERSPRLGVLPAGQSTSAPTPAEGPGTSTGLTAAAGSSACWARGGPISSRGARRALTGAPSMRTSTARARAPRRWRRRLARPARARSSRRSCTVPSWSA